MLLDLNTLGHVLMAIVTLVAGLVTGWLAKHMTQPPPSAIPAESAPRVMAGGAVAPPSATLMDQLMQSLSASGSVLTFPGSDAHARKQELFHTLAQSILALPLPPDMKSKAMQELVGFLDRIFATPTSPPPPAKP